MSSEHDPAETNGNGRKQKKEKKLSILQRMMLQAIGDEVALGNPNDPLADQFPNLYEFMTNTDVPGGMVKSPAYLRVSPVVGGWLAVLTDPDMGQALEVPLNELQSLWKAMEDAITTNTGTWKNWGKKGVNFRKKKGKS